MNAADVPSGEERRTLLLTAKLRGLLGDHLSESSSIGDAAVAVPDEITDLAVEAIPGGVAATVGGTAWLLVDGAAARGLGPALAWASRREVESIGLIADDALGLLARRAASLRIPVSIWTSEGRRMIRVDPEPLESPDPPPAEHLALAGLIEEAGADVNVEHGVVTGEVRGLEVCRVVDTPTTGRLLEQAPDGQLVPLGSTMELRNGDRATPAPGDGEVFLEVGVGAHDREAFQLLHGDVPTARALSGVVESVARHRSVEAPGHPLNRMARERLLRWHAVVDPTSVGFAELRPAAPPVERPSMKLAAPCVAVGRRAEDDVVRTVVFSSGVDLDVVPFALDAAQQQAELAGADRAVTVALPSRDLLPVTEAIAGLAAVPVDFVRLG
ncbi:MAG: hypothetical protein AAGD33_10530 [Actinomycetota bacterium]